MNIVIFGAHPDDAEVYAGGTMLRWVDAGCRVHVVSLTNGDIGHYAQCGSELAVRRARESALAAERGGYTTQTLHHHDGELMPSLELRREIVRLIREHRADVVLAHRPCDYHPDHRYASMAVQDAAFMVTVPNFCPDTPYLKHNPVFLYMMDRFQRPVPFHPDIAVAVDAVMERKWRLIDAMESQFYEWLPFLEGIQDRVPTSPGERFAWLKAAWGSVLTQFTRQYAHALGPWYGAEAQTIGAAEYFEVCEYGSPLPRERVRDFFPFLP